MGEVRQDAPRRSPWRRAALLCLAAPLALGLVLAALAARPYPLERLRPTTSLTIADRRGRVLRQLPLPGGGRADWVPLDEIPPTLVLCTLAGEDQRFYEHGGVDPGALLRAALLNLRERRLGFGGSTLTMQLARLLEPHRRGLRGKLADVVGALRLERTLDKRALLEQYLNRAYYGNGAYGVEAAARRYFGRPARELAAGEAALLAVLPRAPSAYDPRRALDVALRRRGHVLALLGARGQLSAEERARIERTPLQLAPPGGEAFAGPQRAPFLAPHFVDHVLLELPERARRDGGLVRTTLDLDLQLRLQEAVRAHLRPLAPEHVGHAGALVLDPRSGAILAMVGSPDYLDRARGGQLNITTAPRHPGSALKPFTYALALEQGDTAATIAWDLSDGLTTYRSRNADQRQHGPVRYRTALACSYNLAALHVAERVGPGRLLDRLRLAGLGTLREPADAYGAALTLGAGPVRLLDLAAAYSFLVRGGLAPRPRAIEELAPPRSLVPLGTAPAAGVQPTLPPRRLFSEEVSWLVMDMLADAEARRPAFGDDLPFDLPYPVAAKTGTSGGFSDNVALIATREYVVAAWAGNFDGSAMHAVLAMAGAAPLGRAALRAAADGRALTLPPRPAAIVERPVCALSGQVPGPACPHKRERFLRGTEPQAPCAWHRAAADGGLAIEWPAEARAWAARRRLAGGQSPP